MHNATWNDALYDKGSTMHKALAAGILKEMEDMLPSQNLHIDIVYFQPGSIVIKFRYVLSLEPTSQVEELL